MAKKNPGRHWTWAPSKMLKPKVPDDLKKEVQTKADDLVAKELTPKYIKPPPRGLGGTILSNSGRNGIAAFSTSAPLGQALAPIELLRRSRCGSLGWSMSVIAASVSPIFGTLMNG